MGRFDAGRVLFGFCIVESMKKISKNEAHEFKNSDVCIALEYPLHDSEINIAEITITGRYPDAGRVMNQKCKEVAFVMEGSGKAVVDDREVSLSKGDAVLIEVGEKIYWQGNLTLLISCTPAWSSEQYTHID